MSSHSIAISNPSPTMSNLSLATSNSSSSSDNSEPYEGFELKPLVDEEKLDEQYLATAASAKEIRTDPSTGENVGHHHSPHGEFGVGNSSPIQVAVNIFISFVGSGMLGMPYAFKQSGWLLGIITLSFMSLLNIYAMLLLVQTRKKLEADGHTGMFGYGDVGRIISGRRGENFVNICLVISQVGFATAYIIFISANLNNIAGIHTAYICFGCVPILAVLVQIQDMKYLAPFSLIADIANLSGLCAVLLQDFTAYRVSHEIAIPYNFSNVLYVASVSLYALEGVGLVLPLESSCKDRKWFPSLLRNTIVGITSLMAVFGCCGYFAFGSETEAPITLNLEGFWATLVKLALCVGLYLTFPIMLFPVNEVMEDFVLSDDNSKPNRPFRTSVVILSAFIAYAIPDFGKVREFINIFSIFITFLPK